ncbi:MAG: PQQ-dependent sugar dehydrogenase [Candidatus Dojkabacteria bacterium]|nr:MAG: PQQ-dependent sugar dehydrogenase [Candidatus Dojkabacteria bacterium]
MSTFIKQRLKQIGSIILLSDIVSIVRSLKRGKEIFTGIPGAAIHDGGRMVFGPDGMLYIATGDANRSESAQVREHLHGKILRVTDEGMIPSDNPFSGSPVFSLGHRNPQGLSWDTEGRLWSSEHGRSGVASGYDEINLIEAEKIMDGPPFKVRRQKWDWFLPLHSLELQLRGHRGD